MTSKSAPLPLSWRNGGSESVPPHPTANLDTLPFGHYHDQAPEYDDDIFSRYYRSFLILHLWGDCSVKCLDSGAVSTPRLPYSGALHSQKLS